MRKGHLLGCSPHPTVPLAPHLSTWSIEHFWLRHCTSLPFLSSAIPSLSSFVTHTFLSPSFSPPASFLNPVCSKDSSNCSCLSVISRYIFWKRVPSGYEHYSCCCCCSCACCYRIFHSLRLCRFSTDRKETFHTY